ncbi:hypothetical protein Syun_001251 [Stephania yunnanensis]|uniref:Uncharacterized protein n=1 Tax=Stephania yunnanensis TaxID=152371 RepID=A0AAP0LDR3_9MAGN
MSLTIITPFIRSRTTKPPPEIKMSSTQARTTFLFFFFRRFRLGGTKDRCFLPVQSRYYPLILLQSAYRGIKRDDLGPESVGLGYITVSAMGDYRGCASTVHSVGMRKSLIVGTAEPDHDGGILYTVRGQTQNIWVLNRSLEYSGIYNRAFNIEYTMMTPIFISWKSPAKKGL